MSARRFVLVAAAVGGVVGAVLTFPLLAHVRSAVLDDGTYDASSSCGGSGGCGRA